MRPPSGVNLMALTTTLRNACTKPLHVRLKRGQAAQSARRERQFALLDGVGQRLNRHTHDAFERSLGEAQVHRVHVKLAHVEHRADQFFHALGGFAQIVDHAAHLIGVEHPRLVERVDDVGVAANLRQWRSQFVAGDGDEVGFDRVEPLHLFFRAFQRLIE